MKDLSSKSYNFNVALKTLPTEGNLVYEYNPLYNYRLDRTMIFYKNLLMEVEEFCNELGITDSLLERGSSWAALGVPATETPPIVYLAGQLVDFETNELDFSLSNPVSIIPLYSYDDSVNLIINDGKNPPRLINTRFSATERNRYLVCNRKGNNDSNIYDLGEQFDIDTSLYKKINTIPKLKFLGVGYGGNLGIGNYHFYLRYVDEDGNESDFFAESGLVSIFIGNSADSIHTGFRDECSHKQVKFLLSNTDPGYSKVAIYYTKSTADILENATVLAKKIEQTFRLGEEGSTLITISGFEETKEVSISEINAFYQIYGSAETQAAALNILFLANVDRVKVPYEDLADCALRFLPVLDTKEEYNINQIGLDYSGSVKNTYYDPTYIYNKLGYWDDEIYRFGIVFIKSDNTLTEVFNVRGRNIRSSTTYDSYTKIPFKDDDENRQYVNYDETYYNIINSESGSSLDVDSLENAKGVVHIQHSNFNSIIGINFIVPNEVLTYLRDELKIKGYFFVRQKRIPTTLCQAYTIGIDKESHTPVLPTSEGFIAEGFLTKGEKKMASGSGAVHGAATSNKVVDAKLLSHDFEKRLYTLENQQVSTQGAICPDYDVNSPYLNSLFSASELVVRDCDTQKYLTRTENHFYPSFDFVKADSYSNVKIVGVEDNVKLVGINDYLFSARAGEAEEAFRFEYIGKKNVNKDATNLLRGSFGPFLGITGYGSAGHLVDIKIPGYNPNQMSEYFRIRYEDKGAFFAISRRYSISEVVIDTVTESVTDEKGRTITANKWAEPMYRGDCYVCQFTHRFNRNFLDPSAPTNDEIVDPKCWADNFDVSDGIVKKENFEKINLGDVNAVRLGMYVTLVVRSTMNLNVRSLDNSIPDEEAMFGHSRGFYPYFPMTTKGAYKTPEALCYNKGFEKSLSERYAFEVPNVPWIKNEFSTRIAYSNMLAQDAFLNGWRTFLGTHYRDYPKTYGSITKLIELRGNLLCVFEHGVALIPVNERAIAGEGSGGNIYINTSNVLPENPKVISDTFGSQWRDSIIKTPRGVYGVDTVAKKIWRTNGEEFECISDFRIQEFLNQNISLTERELTPIIGVRNVKTHYNKFKKDVMFTFYDNLHGFNEKVWNICFNESMLKWITFYSWVPSYSENIYNEYFSFDRNTSKWIAKLGVSHHDNDFSDGITLSENIITRDNQTVKIYLDNRTLPQGTGVKSFAWFELVRDNYLNYLRYSVDPKVYAKNSSGAEVIIFDGEKLTDAGKKEWTEPYGKLTFRGNYKDICSEFYVREKDGIAYFSTLAKELMRPCTIGGVLLESKQQVTYSEALQIFSRPSLVGYFETWWMPKLEIVEGEAVETGEMIEVLDAIPSNISGKYVTIYNNFIAVKKEKGSDGLYHLYMYKLNYNPRLGEWDPNYIAEWNTDWENSISGSPLKIHKDDKGRRVWLDKNDLVNGDKVVQLINIKAHIEVVLTVENVNLAEAIQAGQANLSYVDAGYYESVVALIPKYNMLFLTTDFWKHGLAGIIDIADKIYPTYWYGKQHPFEFEFVVADNPDKHKIFDNLQIISNKAAPESFHYEIVGECYDFAKDKKNMYIRLEATKELYQYNGSDVVFNEDYKELESYHRPLTSFNPLQQSSRYQQSWAPKYYDKSTILPLYYSRQKPINDIEDYYHLYGQKDQYGKSDLNFSSEAGGEIVRYENLDEYRIWNHAMGVDMATEGPARGNMYYKEDVWNVQINPLNIYLANEPDWAESDIFSAGRSDLVPVEINQCPIPEDVKDKEYFQQNQSIRIPEWWERSLVLWEDPKYKHSEAKLKDKFIKIRIRYSGQDLAIISAIKTLYSISYA